MKGPTVMMANVCSISGITEPTKIRKQVIRDFLTKEQPDIMGLIETNIKEVKFELKGKGDYVIYQTKPNKDKGALMAIKEEMHPMIKDRFDSSDDIRRSNNINDSICNIQRRSQASKTMSIRNID